MTSCASVASMAVIVIAQLKDIVLRCFCTFSSRMAHQVGRISDEEAASYFNFHDSI